MQTNQPNQPGLSKVKTSVNEPRLMKLIVEELAGKRNHIGMAGKSLDINLVGMDTSSTETFVTGNISFEFNHCRMSIPFITGFVFTCLKSKRSFYEMEWSMSLS